MTEMKDPGATSRLTPSRTRCTSLPWLYSLTRSRAARRVSSSSRVIGCSPARPTAHSMPTPALRACLFLFLRADVYSEALPHGRPEFPVGLGGRAGGGEVADRRA